MVPRTSHLFLFYERRDTFLIEGEFLSFDWPIANAFWNFLIFIGLQTMERMYAHLYGFPASLSVLMPCVPVFIFTSGSSALLGRPRSGLSIWLSLLAIFNTLFWVYANLFHEKTDKTRKYSKSAIFVWYQNGRRRLLGAQSINHESFLLMPFVVNICFLSFIEDKIPFVLKKMWHLLFSAWPCYYFDRRSDPWVNQRVLTTDSRICWTRACNACW